MSIMDEQQTTYDAVAVFMLSTGEHSFELASQYIGRARAVILSQRYPYSSAPQDEPWDSRYDILSVEIAEVLWARRGAEGQVTHTENGIIRQWSSDAIPKQLLSQVVPIAAVP